MPSVMIAGGGLAGLAAAAALGGCGFQVDLFESRGFLGGRATSYPLAPADASSEVIDNCQHVLLRCCVNLLNLYERLGVTRDIVFHREFYFLEPGGRTSVLKAGGLPKPLHLAGSFLRMSCLSLSDKIGLAKALAAIKRERLSRRDLDEITMLEWLNEKKQSRRAIERFWQPVLVSAINEDLDRMAAAHGFQVFWLGFLATSTSFEMGIPAVPLASLYSAQEWMRFPNVRIHRRTPINRIDAEGFIANGERQTADYYVSALPFERLPGIAPELEVPQMEHSPITGIHLWFDRAVTTLPHAVLLDRTIQWMFNKEAGRYVQVVVSASRTLVEKSRTEVVDLALSELGEFFPDVKQARLEKAHVVKEVRATFSAQPKLEALRPETRTIYPKLFLAGDWTRSGWPATMEGAVRSGYIAAEAVARVAGQPTSFLLPDIA